MYSLSRYVMVLLGLPLMAATVYAESIAWSAADTQALGAFIKEQRQQAWELRYREDAPTPTTTSHKQMRAIMNTRIEAQYNARQIQRWIDKLIRARELDLDNGGAYNTAIRGLESYLTGGEFSYTSSELKNDFAEWKTNLEPALKKLDEAALRKYYQRKQHPRWVFLGWVAIDQIHAQEERLLADALNLKKVGQRDAAARP